MTDAQQPAPAPETLASQQVAEALCPCINLDPPDLCQPCAVAWVEGATHSGRCHICNGTGCQYPELSRECPCGNHAGVVHVRHDRVADVTEGKLWAVGNQLPEKQRGLFAYALSRGVKRLEKQRRFVYWLMEMTEAERLEALSAALLKVNHA